MKINPAAMAIASGLLWGGAVLTVGLLNIAKPSYGKRFLRVIDSVYPGYHATADARNVAIGTCYALIDGAVGGAVFASVYNQIESRSIRERTSLKAA
jgi:hypothetical protein